MNKKQNRTKTWGLKSINAMLPDLSRHPAAATIKMQLDLITSWAQIIGPEWADKTEPLRMNFPQGQKREAALHIKIAPMLALELQHQEPQIIERINRFFGFAAVARLHYIQAPVGKSATPAQSPQPPVNIPPTLQVELDKMPPGDLRDTLERLGREIAKKNQPDH